MYIFYFTMLRFIIKHVNGQFGISIIEFLSELRREVQSLGSAAPLACVDRSKYKKLTL